MEPLVALAAPEPATPVSLPASLFTSCGKLAVEIRSLGDDRAAVFSAKRPPVGSFAFLVRNGVKMPATIAWSVGGTLGLSLEDGLVDPRRRATFRRGAPAPCRRRPPAVPADKPLVRPADPIHPASALEQGTQR